MPLQGIPASRPAPDHDHRHQGAEVDTKQLKPITIQDPYQTKPRPTETERVWRAGAHQRQGLEELRKNPSIFVQAHRSNFSLTLLMPLACAILPSADPGFPCLPSGWGSKKRVPPLTQCQVATIQPTLQQLHDHFQKRWLSLKKTTKSRKQSIASQHRALSRASGVWILLYAAPHRRAIQWSQAFIDAFVT